LFATTSLLGAFLIASAVVHAVDEVRRFRAHEPANPFVSGPRLARRLTGATLVIGMTGMLFYGVNYAHALATPRIFVAYWSVCLALIAVLLLLAFFDLRETQRVAAREMRAELKRAMRAIGSAMPHERDERRRTDDEPSER